MILKLVECLFNERDHCWLEYTDSSQYSANNVCDNCKTTMVDFAYVTNDANERGLSSGSALVVVISNERTI